MQNEHNSPNNEHEGISRVNKNSGKVSSIKKIIITSIIITLAWFILYWVSSYSSHKSTVESKIEAHNKMVKEGKEKITKEMDEKVSDLKTKMSPMLDMKDDLRIQGDLQSEYSHVDSQRRMEKAANEEDEEDERVLKELKERATSHDWHERSEEVASTIKYLSCDDTAESKVFRRRSSIIARKNLAKKYIVDVQRLESLNYIDDWDRATINKKKAFIKGAEAINENMSDAEVLQDMIATDGVLQRCKARAEKMIPAYLKYDGTGLIFIYFKRVKKTADLFGVDIDWTVPLMIKKEIDWYDKWKGGELNGEGPCEFQERMDKEYKALGDHPSLKTELFLHYRNKRSRMESAIESCLKGGSYPRNQKLKNLYKEKKKKFENCYRSTKRVADLPDCFERQDAFYKRQERIPKEIEKEIERSRKELSIKW